MFKIQKKIIYALEAVLDIALNSGIEPVTNIAIAKRQGIPKRYLEQTLQTLVKNKILVGSRGPRGGYRLAMERRKIRLSDVLHSVVEKNEDSLSFNSSISQKIIKPLLNDSIQKSQQYLDSLTIEDLCRIAKKNKVQKSNTKKIDFVI